MAIQTIFFILIPLVSSCQIEILQNPKAYGNIHSIFLIFLQVHEILIAI